jgi:hypothetical protein
VTVEQEPVYERLQVVEVWWSWCGMCESMHVEVS